MFKCVYMDNDKQSGAKLGFTPAIDIGYWFGKRRLRRM